MRTSIIASFLAFAASQVTAQYYSNQSAPFNLVLLSSDSTLNGSLLYACHEGAATEGLCTASSSKFTLNSYSLNFNFNTTVEPWNSPGIGLLGILTWELQASGINVSSPMDLRYSSETNVAVPLFQPSYQYINIGFDKDNKLFIPSYLDDSVSPPKSDAKREYRWFVCTTRVGYTYETLAWVSGRHTHPQNPTCQKVEVKRVFV